MAVNGAAALEGNCGLEVIFDGSTTKRYVMDETPDGENTYRISFLINTNTLSMNGPRAIQNNHNMIASEAVTPYGGKIGIQVVFMDKKKHGNYQVKVKAGVYISTNLSKISRKTGPVILQAVADPATTHLVEVEWQTASALDVRDGILRIRVDGGPWSSNTIENYDFGMDLIRFGAVNGIDATTTGSMYLDDFQSFRTLTE